MKNMISAKRWWVALLTVSLLTAGGVAAWVYYIHSSPRTPARARQVMAAEPDAFYARVSLNQQTLWHKTAKSAQTMDRSTQSICKEAE
ncbi:MAG: hypothetical protein RIN56_00820 [Sporomusaceae bacterium]|nr:hypothetical protein [Sporomusaceae bacterium]